MRLLNHMFCLPLSKNTTHFETDPLFFIYFFFFFIIWDLFCQCFSRCTDAAEGQEEGGRRIVSLFDLWMPLHIFISCWTELRWRRTDRWNTSVHTFNTQGASRKSSSPQSWSPQVFRLEPYIWTYIFMLYFILSYMLGLCLGDIYVYSSAQMSFRSHHVFPAKSQLNLHVLTPSVLVLVDTCACSSTVVFPAFVSRILHRSAPTGIHRKQNVNNRLILAIGVWV